jgi:hypothetical protein
MRSTIAVLAILLALWSCKGADGAVGPQGPQGAIGPSGPTGAKGQTRISLTGNLDADGVASRTLPAAAGDGSNLPLFACYQLLNNSWATEALGGQRCVIGDTPAPLQVAMVNGQPFAAYTFVVVY